MSLFLTRCAQASTQTPTRINYVTMMAANGGDLGRLKAAISGTLDRVLRRQAALAALDIDGLTNDAIAYVGAGGPGFLISTTTPIRSSHSGAPVDLLLPQAPYSVVPPAATAGIRGRANWAWLQASTTPHTTNANAAQAADPNRVASYFELHIPTIRDGAGVLQLDGGRLVFDPYNHRFFLSSHYAAQYELINVPAVTAVPAYAATRQAIQAFANANPGVVPPPWAVYLATVDADIQAGTL